MSLKFKNLVIVLVSLLFFLSIFIIYQSKSNENYEKKFSICDANFNSTSERSKCKAEVLSVLPPNKISEKIRSLEGQGIFKNDCHLTSHYIGRILASDIDYNYFDSYLDPELCSQGLLHGFIEGVGDKGNTNTLVSLGKKLCSKKDSGCIHGFGHSLSLANLEPKLVSEICPNVSQFVSLDRDIEEGKHSRYNCVSGYFMQENIINKSNYENKSKEELFANCEHFKDLENQFCKISLYRTFLYYPEIEAAKNRFSLKAIKEDLIFDKKAKDFQSFCESISDSYIKLICLDTLGMAISDHYNFDREKEFVSLKIFELCLENYNCYNGFLQMYISQLQSESESYFDNFCRNKTCKDAYSSARKYLLKNL